MVLDFLPWEIGVSDGTLEIGGTETAGAVWRDDAKMILGMRYENDKSDLSKDQLDSSEKANNLKGEEVQLLSVTRKRSESNLEVLQLLLVLPQLVLGLA